MNRLTERDEYGNADIIGVDSEDLQLNLDFEGFNRVTEALNRLASYEETGLEPEEIKRSDALLRCFIDLSRRNARTLPWMEKVMIADREGRLIVLPCGDDVTLESNGLLYKGDHWNPPTLTAFADDPSTASGLRLRFFSVEDAEKELEATREVADEFQEFRQTNGYEYAEEKLREMITGKEANGRT